MTSSQLRPPRLGNGVLIGLVLCDLLLWLFFPPRLLAGESSLRIVSEFLGTVAVILLAFSIVLSTRVRFLESWFGGLDKMYLAHKRNGILAILFLLAHFFTMPRPQLPADAVPAFSPGAPLGMLAFVGLLMMVIAAVAPRIPFIGGHISLTYRRWQVSHKAIGVFFVISVVHSILVDSVLERSLPLQVFIGVISVLGIVAYAYKLVLFGMLRRKIPYVVKEVNRMNPSVAEVVLEPRRKRLMHRAGQFLFVEFEGDGVMSESHPFTISSSPDCEEIHLTIRASGDYTKHVVENLKVGTGARLEGSYGCFDYSKGGGKQVWIAGGIGLTPFLSWVRQFKADERVVDLFYSASSKEDALFLDELERAATENPNLRIHVSFSNVDGHLTVGKISDQVEDLGNREFFFCGPVAMTESLVRQLKKRGVKQEDMHYEEFSFR